MPNLLLQKPSKNSKVKDDLTAVERRMQSWLKRGLMELLHEGEMIRRNLTQQLTKGDIGKISNKFTTLIRKGNVNAAINLVTQNMKNRYYP